MARLPIAIVLTLSAVSMCVMAGKYQFFLAVLDMLDPSWIHSTYDVIGTKIKCASLCYQNEENCAYFGYKNHTCYLLKYTVDRENCSQENCTDRGMKVYKWEKQMTTTTTTTVPSTTTSTTPETTSTTTTTTVPPSTTTTTTTEPPTTTTTTTEPSTTTTTTEMSTTTTTQMTTTTTIESTTPEELICDADHKAQEAEVFCGVESYLLKGIGSRYPFFSDVVGATCSRFNQKIFSDEEHVHKFLSPDGGISISAKCPDENQVIVKFKICVKDFHVWALTLHCHDIKDPGIILDRFNKTSDPDKHLKVLCGMDEDMGLNKIYFMDSGDGIITRAVFGCIQVEAEKGPVDMPDEPSAEKAGGPSDTSGVQG